MAQAEVNSLRDWASEFVLPSLPPFNALEGWSAPTEKMPTFVEPELRLREDLETKSTPVRLVSASGAVGKSTYASQLAAEYGMILVDLGTASPVAGNYLSGGLVRTGLVTGFQSGKVGVVIDALDEAKLRVTSESYAAFIEDVARLSKASSSPLILFGREGAIEEAWLALDGEGISPPIYEIKRFDRAKAIQFVMARLDRVEGDAQKYIQQFRIAFQTKIGEIIDQLAESTEDGRKVGSLEFAGYAPVLEAVAAYASEFKNPAAYVDLQRTGLHLIDEIIEQVLVRESGKVQQPVKLMFPDVDTKALYTAGEQRRLLLASLNGEAPRFNSVSSRSDVQQAYEEAALGLLQSHPFLDGTGRAASSAVFEADLLREKLTTADQQGVPAGLQKFSKPGNPFLMDLFLSRLAEDDQVLPEHIGHLFASAQALLSAGQSAELSFEQDDDESEDASVSIVHRQISDGSVVRRWEFGSHIVGEIVFFSPLGNISIGGNINVRFGDAQTGASVIAPVDLDCSTLTVLGSELIASVGPSVSRADTDDAAKSIILSGERLVSNELERIRVSGGARLLADFPEAKEYPWSSYHGDAPFDFDSEEWNKKLALRRILGVFRADNSGELRQSFKKLDGRRMTKGWGARIRDALLRDSVLTKDGRTYLLDADRMAAVLQTSYVDVSKRNFGKQVSEWLRTV